MMPVKRPKCPYVIVTFHTTTEAMAMEQYCAEHEIPGRIIPVPREISSGCGLCWRTPMAQREPLDQHLSQIVYEKVYEILQ